MAGLVHSDLAFSSTNLNDLLLADASLQKMLLEYRDQYRLQHVKTLNISKQIADLCVKQGRLDDARLFSNSFKKYDAQKSEAMLRAALQGLENACGPSSELTACAARTLGSPPAQDKFAESEKAFQKALAYFEANLRPQAPLLLGLSQGLMKAKMGVADLAGKRGDIHRTATCQVRRGA